MHAQQQELLALQRNEGAEFGTPAASEAAGLVHQDMVREVAAAAEAKGINHADVGLEFKTPEQLAAWAKANALEIAFW